MKKLPLVRLICFNLLFVISSLPFAQELPVVPAFERAYSNMTRSQDGKPGKYYWQNKSSYDISVTLDTKTNTITGTEAVVYSNNSPDTLDRLVFRLYPNISRKDAKREAPQPDGAEYTDGMIIDELVIADAKIPLSGANYEMTGTNLIIKGLKIAPGSYTKVTAKWHYKVINAPRTGVYGGTNYFIAYWYPQIGVYDDIDGWDMTEYTGTVEFYNDFNDYDVKITVPNNYLVWATGELQNAKQVLMPQILARWEEAHNSTETVHIISEQDYLQRALRLNADSETNTWLYKADNVTDFTFAASDKYLWDARAVNVGVPDILMRERKVFVSAAYDEATTLWKEMAYVTAVTVERMSKEVPGVPFPFPCMTIFNGAGGMESPMMVNQGPGGQRIWMVYTAVHEVAHSYFPFYMGINERKYAWMDEGQAQMLMEYIEWGLDTTMDFRAYDTKRYMDYAGKDSDVPPMNDSRLSIGTPYGSHAYFKPSVAYNILKDMLGEELYLRCMQEYMKRWSGKHPMPYDYFNTFSEVSKKSLNWFFIPWFFEKSAPDLSLKNVKWETGKINITVERRGILPVPVYLRFDFANGKTMSVLYPASVWEDGETEFVYESGLTDDVTSVTLGNEYIPDVNEKDNFWRANDK